MAGTIPTITPGSITIDRALSSKPIYFVKVGGVALVIKGEAPGMGQMNDSDRGISIQWTSKLMKNINNKLVNTKIMTQQEVGIFKAVGLLKFGMGTKEREYLENPRFAQNIWVKMPLVGGLSDGNFFNDEPFAKAIPSRVKQVIVKFLDEDMWPPLGKVLAVDIFNANNDRFDTQTGRWQNFGNVMFLEGGDTSIIGLDTFDPNSPEANLNSTPPQGMLEPLRALIDPVRMNAFARACTESVGDTLARQGLGPGCQKVTIALNGPEGKVTYTITAEELKKLYVGNARWLAAGIQKGSDQLKTYLQDKVRQYRQQAPRPLPPLPGQRPRGGAPLVRPVMGPVKPNNMPQGIWDRMVFLGWAV